MEKLNAKIENMIYEIRGVQAMLSSEISRPNDITKNTRLNFH